MLCCFFYNHCVHIFSLYAKCHPCQNLRSGAGKAGNRSLAFLGTVVSLVLTLVAWERYNTTTGGFQLVSHLNWFTLPNLWQSKDLVVGLTFGVDGLSLPLLTLGSLVAVLAIVGGKGAQERAKEYYLWLSLASTGIFGVFSALDIFTFLVALEVTLFSTFFLIYIFGEEGRQKAAFKFLIYRGLATVALLVALIGIALVS